jgi:DNA-binding PadR family transcriptional regulator
MRRLEEQAGGRWRPSPGSVYPLMQLLEDESLVQSTEYEGRKVYELTPAGREQALPTWTCAVRLTDCVRPPVRSGRWVRPRR